MMTAKEFRKALAGTGCDTGLGDPAEDRRAAKSAAPQRTARVVVGESYSTLRAREMAANK